MKKLIKLMALITALTFCIGTTVFASEPEYDSVEGGDIDLDGDGNDGDQSTGLEGEGDEDDESSNIDGEDADVDADEEESTAGGTASPQTSASIAPIVAMVGIAAAGAAAGLKRK